MGLKLSNFGRAKLATPPSGTGGLSFTVESGKGALFPTLGAGDYVYLVLKNATKTNNEIVKVEARSGDAFTIATGGRGADGTTAQTWTANDYVECCLTNAALIEVFNAAVTAIGALTPAADKVAYFTGASGAALATITAFARLRLADADQAAAFAAVVAAGGTLTGALTLAADPTSALHAATLRYANLGHGRCRIAKSGANIVLNGYDGASLIINGVLRSFTPGTPSLSPSGLTPGTNYYIYAYWDGTEVKLEASTTGHSTHTDGVEIKTGDATRTLVGLARCVTGPAWADSLTQRLILNWFNRRQIIAKTQLSGGSVSTGATSLTELSSSLRLDFLCWSGGLMKQTARSSVSHDSGGGSHIDLCVALTTPSQGNAPARIQVATALAGLLQPMTAENNGLPGEGYFYGTIYVLTSAGTATFDGSAYTSNEVVIEG